MKHDNKITPAKPGLDPKIDQTVLARLAALKTLSVKDLKAEWENLFSTAAPNNSRKFLEFRIAYRIQELTYGGPDRETRRMLDLLAEEVEGHARRKHRIADPRNPVIGTRLHPRMGRRRAYGDRLKRRFRLAGAQVQIALGRGPRHHRHTWNGYRFFGLRERKREQA